MTQDIALFNETESQVRSYCRRFPTVFERASGSLMHGADGSCFIDFLSCAGAVNYGHNPSSIKAALIDYLAGDGIQAALDLHTVAKRDFIAAFRELVLAPRKMNYRLQFTGPTGTSVVESAVKLARKVTSRKNVMAFTNGFHGMSGTSLGLTANAYHRQDVQDPYVTRVPYEGYLQKEFDSIAYLRKLFTDKSSGVDIPAAVVVETIQGEGGVNVASAEWLQALRALTSEHGILLIVDDIQAGCGRTGSFFSFEFAGIVPDLVCLSKSLSGYGLPFSLLLISPAHDQWRPAEDNGTFRGNTMAIVTATAALVHFWRDDRLQRDIGRRESLVRQTLFGLMGDFPEVIRAVRGRGLFYGVEFFDPLVAADVTASCFQHRLIIERCGAEGQVAKLLPALTIDDTLLVEGLMILSKAVSECALKVRANCDLSEG